MNAATQLKAVDIHKTDEPIIVDPLGNEIRTQKGLMVKIDQKASERVEVSKGTMWFAPLLVALGMLLFNYVGGLVGWTGRVGVVEVKVDQTQKDIKALDEKFNHLQHIILEQRVLDAEKKGEVRGFALGQEATK